MCVTNWLINYFCALYTVRVSVYLVCIFVYLVWLSVYTVCMSVYLVCTSVCLVYVSEYLVHLNMCVTKWLINWAAHRKETMNYVIMWRDALKTDDDVALGVMLAICQCASNVVGSTQGRRGQHKRSLYTNS